MPGPRLRTTRGKILIWILGGIGTTLAGLATLAASHVLTWFDPPDTTTIVLAQNDVLVRSLTQTLDRLTSQPAAVSPPVAATSAPAVAAPLAPVTVAMPVSSALPPAASEASPVVTEPVATEAPPSASVLPLSSAVTLSSAIPPVDVAEDRPAPRAEVTIAAPSAAAVSPAARAEASETLVANLPSVPALPAAAAPTASDAELAAPPSAAPADVAAAPASFSVFENQKFAMCGHDDFAMRLSGTKLVLASNDRSIPGRTFRGYEKTLDPGQATELWPGCSVAAGYTTAVGVVRIAISVIGGK